MVSLLLCLMIGMFIGSTAGYFFCYFFNKDMPYEISKMKEDIVHLHTRLNQLLSK